MLINLNRIVNLIIYFFLEYTTFFAEGTTEAA